MTKTWQLQNADTGRKEEFIQGCVTADGKRTFERTGLGWKDDIKVYRKEI